MAKGGVLSREGESRHLLGASGAAGRTFATTVGPVITEFHHPNHLHHLGGGGIIERNPVEQLFKHALVSFAIFLFFSFLGILFLILKFLGFDELPAIASLPQVTKTFWAICTPFWIADVAAVATLLHILIGTCTLRTTTRDEKRNIARLAPREANRSISIEMLPLVQHLIRGMLSIFPVVALVIATQILICCFLEYGKPNLWIAMLPVIVMQGMILLGTICFRTGSSWRTVGWFLVLLATITLSLRFSPRGVWPFPRGNPLHPVYIAFLPLWFFNVLFLVYLFYVSTQGCFRRRYHLTTQHIMCITFYTVSILFTTTAEVLISWHLLDGRIEHELHFKHMTAVVTGILLFVGIGLAELGIYLMIAEEIDHLITTHGYGDPLPLSRTSRGWEPTGSKSSFWCLLGRIEESARLRYYYRGNGRGGIGSGGGLTRIGGGYESPTGGAGGGGGGGDRSGMKRSNSGSYADLYDDL